MRTALLGLLLVSACAHSPARPTPAGESVALPCTVSQDDTQIAGGLASFDGLTFCAPARWRAVGASAWTSGGGRVTWARTIPHANGTSPRFTGSRGAQIHAPIDGMVVWRDPIPMVVSGGVEASALHAARSGGGVNFPSTARLEQVRRAWSEELDGITARFEVTVDSRGQWRTVARWSDGLSGVFATGTAGTVAEVEEQLAVLRTVRPMP